jgi:hypothetical protein
MPDNVIARRAAIHRHSIGNISGRRPFGQQHAGAIWSAMNE